jgi:bifunctional pyridoxal-dependent enzyme with beta-cystathionase and maltose regulon repressor activities
VAPIQRCARNGRTDFAVATLRARRINKWHKFPDDVLPAGVADTDFGIAPAIAEARRRLACDQDYGCAARRARVHWPRRSIQTSSFHRASVC